MTHVRLADQKEDVWRRHILRWQQSGQTQRVYCEENDLALSTFQLWRRRLQHGDRTPSSDTRWDRSTGTCVDLVLVPQPVRPAVTEHALVVVLNDGRHRLEIGDGIRAETLRTVVNVLEAQP